LKADLATCYTNEKATTKAQIAAAAKGACASEFTALAEA